MRQFFFACAIFATLPRPATGDANTVIVISDKAEAFAGNTSIGSIPPGSALHFSKQNGPWLMVPRLRGWVHREQVVPLAEAEAYFTNVLAEHESAEGFHHRAIARIERGQYEDALADIDRAIEEGLNTAAVHVNRGNALQHLQRYEDAVAEYTRAIEIDESSAGAYDNRSTALAALDRLDASLADSDRAVEIDPDFAEAFNNRGVTRQLQGEWQAAIDDYTAAVEKFGGYSAAYANRGYAHKHLGNFAAAITDYEAAIHLQPDWPGARNDLAWLLATCPRKKHRDGARAAALAEKACELDPENGEYLDTLAAAYAADERFEEAVRTAEKALEKLEGAARAATETRLALYRENKPFREENAK